MGNDGYGEAAVTDDRKMVRSNTESALWAVKWTRQTVRPVGRLSKRDAANRLLEMGEEEDLKILVGQWISKRE